MEKVGEEIRILAKIVTLENFPPRMVWVGKVSRKDTQNYFHPGGRIIRTTYNILGISNIKKHVPTLKLLYIVYIIFLG